MIEGMGFHVVPVGIQHDVSTTSEESETEEDDPTKEVPATWMTDAWEKMPQPGRGAGRWGFGPPTKVHHGYRSRDLVDGTGLCSPGRWPPGRRNLPDVGDPGKDLLTAMGVCIKEFEPTIYRIMLGKTDASPFTADQVKRGKDFLTSWCAARGVPPVRGDRDLAQSATRGSSRLS